MSMSRTDPATPAVADQARADAVRDLESEFSTLINQFRQIIHEVANRVSPGMLPGAYKVFTTIAQRAPITQSELSEHLLVDKGQLSRTVRELEGLGLVQRDPDPNDRRSNLLSPTDLGSERLRMARKPHGDLLERTLENWEIDDIHSLTRLLHALTAGTRP